LEQTSWLLVRNLRRCGTINTQEEAGADADDASNYADADANPPTLPVTYESLLEMSRGNDQ